MGYARKAGNTREFEHRSRELERLKSLFGEQSLLTTAKAYQDATGFHKKHPETFV